MHSGKTVLSLLIIIIITRVNLIGSSTHQNEPKSCADIERNCDGGCKKNRIKFIVKCRSLIQERNKEPHCDMKCRDLLIEMENQKHEKALLECMCESEMACVVFQRRIDRCIHQTLTNTTNCSVKLQECKNHTVCFGLYKEWFEKCQDVFIGLASECSSSCMKSLTALYTNEIGKFLNVCECAGGFEDERFCLTTREQMKKLCTKAHTMPHTVPSHTTAIIKDEHFAKQINSTARNDANTLRLKLIPIVLYVFISCFGTIDY